MANLIHRTTANNRYSLRGHAPQLITLQTTATQCAKNAAARRVHKTWPITRENRRSRGLRRIGNTCFRLSGLQALLHLPKFLNWILSHNSTQPDGTITFPCRNLNETGMALVARLNGGSRNLVTLPRCPACVVKQFIQAYWGPDNVDPRTGAPQPWAHGHAEMVSMRDLDTRIRSATFGAASGTQEDPVEFQERLLEACLASTDHTIPGNETWLDIFNALFIMEYDTQWHCACGALQPLAASTALERIGIDNLAILPMGIPDSVTAALTREMTPEILGNFDCAVCLQRRPRTQHKRIDGAPDILRIKISNATASGERNDNPIRLDKVIDLGAWAAVTQNPEPLRYRLRSVLCHGGTLTGGHWTATVTDVVGVNTINDHVVVRGTDRGLRTNPQNGRQAVVVTYLRMWSKGG